MLTNYPLIMLGFEKGGKEAPQPIANPNAPATLYHLSNRFLGTEAMFEPNLPVNAHESEQDLPARVCASPSLAQCWQSIRGKKMHQAWASELEALEVSEVYFFLYRFDQTSAFLQNGAAFDAKETAEHYALEPQRGVLCGAYRISKHLVYLGASEHLLQVDALQAAINSNQPTYDSALRNAEFYELLHSLEDVKTIRALDLKTVDLTVPEGLPNEFQHVEKALVIDLSIANHTNPQLAALQNWCNIQELKKAYPNVSFYNADPMRLTLPDLRRFEAYEIVRLKLENGVVKRLSEYKEGSKKHVDNLTVDTQLNSATVLLTHYAPLLGMNTTPKREALIMRLAELKAIEENPKFSSKERAAAKKEQRQIAAKIM